jgi:DNA-binding response OmpR family regulator
MFLGGVTKLQILLIDERPGTLEFFGEAMFNYGYKTGIARGRDEIIPMLANGQYDVILTNGGSRGIDIIKQIKSQVSSVYVICMKGSEHTELCDYAGADLYLERPLRVSSLRQAIENQLYQ